MADEKFMAQLHKDAPPMSISLTQDEFDAWESYYLARTREVTGEENNPFLFVDLNDAKLNLLTLIRIVNRHPELRARASAPGFVDDILRNAMGPRGGMAMGSMYIAQQLGSDPEEAQRIMFTELFAKP